MKPGTGQLLFLCLCSVLSLRLTTGATMKSICGVTTDPDVCLSSSKHLAGGNVDAYKVLEAQVMSAKVEVEAALSVISRTLGKPTASGALKEALTSCKYGYDDVLSDAESALEAIKARDKGRMNSEFSAIIADSSCDDHFEDRPGVESPVSGYDKMLIQAAGNCLDITEKLIH